MYAIRSYYEQTDGPTIRQTDLRRAWATPDDLTRITSYNVCYTKLLRALPVVKVGDEVSAEQLLARGNGRFSVPIHAPLAGTVTAIDGGAIQLKVSQEQTLQPPLRRDASLLEPMAMMDLIEAAGIVGMGGAMFPTADSYNFV